MLVSYLFMNAQLKFTPPHETMSLKFYNYLKNNESPPKNIYCHKIPKTIK